MKSENLKIEVLMTMSRLTGRVLIGDIVDMDKQEIVNNESKEKLPKQE